MKVADLLEARRENWRELETLCDKLTNRRRRSQAAPLVARFAALYRAACADLALSDAYQLPPNTVQYLHQLVGRAHNQLYHSRAFHFADWGREMLLRVPRRLLHDRTLWLAFCIFWGAFLAAAFCAYVSPRFTEEAVGREMMQSMEEMYAKPLARRNANEAGVMAGFYVQHNAGIGLQCFAAGLLIGVAGLFITASNAVILGAVFGHMATVPQRDNFFNFVTAHGPFELTAIVLASAAGMRLGFSIVDTRGQTRIASLRRAGREALPAMCASIILFGLAAIIEGFISPTELPYAVKAAVALISTVLLLAYVFVLGTRREVSRATG